MKRSSSPSSLGGFRWASEHPSRQRLKEMRRQIDRELRKSEIQPREIRQGPTGYRKHQPQIALRGHESKREGALPARGQKQENSAKNNGEEHHESKRCENRCGGWGRKKTATYTFHDGGHENEEDENIETVDSLLLSFDGSYPKDSTQCKTDQCGTREDCKQLSCEEQR